MFKIALQYSAVLIAAFAVDISTGVGAQETAIPNFMYTDFSWQANSGLAFRIAGLLRTEV
jgi:hypothetical protein